MTDMMTPEEISYIREWANSGNEPRPWWRIKEYARGVVDMVGTVGSSINDDLHQLDSIGLTIAALADAMEQANAAVAIMYEHGSMELSRDELAAVNANKRRLLG